MGISAKNLYRLLDSPKELLSTLVELSKISHKEGLRNQKIITEKSNDPLLKVLMSVISTGNDPDNVSKLINSYHNSQIDLINKGFYIFRVGIQMLNAAYSGRDINILLCAILGFLPIELVNEEKIEDLLADEYLIAKPEKIRITIVTLANIVNENDLSILDKFIPLIKDKYLKLTIEKIFAGDEFEDIELILKACCSKEVNELNQYFLILREGMRMVHYGEEPEKVEKYLCSLQM